MLTFFFNGLGLLGLFIPALSAILFEKIIPNSPLASSIGMTLGAILTYYLGKYLNARPPTYSEDFKLKHVSLFRFPHSFLGIRMENCGIIAGFVAVGLMIDQTTLSQMTNPYYLVAGIMLVWFYNRIVKPIRKMDSKNKSTKKSSKEKIKVKYQTKEQLIN